MKEIEQQLETVSEEYKKKMKECDEEKGRLRKSFIDVLQQEGDFKKEGPGKSIQQQFNSYIQEKNTGFEMSVDDAVDKLINKIKPSETIHEMARRAFTMKSRPTAVTSTKGGKKKKVGKRTRKKKNIKKTRK